MVVSPPVPCCFWVPFYSWAISILPFIDDGGEVGRRKMCHGKCLQSDAHSNERKLCKVIGRVV